MFGIFGRKKGRAAADSGISLRKGGNEKGDILLEAARYVTFVSSIKGLPELLVTSIADPIRCSSSNELWNGVSFMFQSREGVAGKIYFFPNFVSAWPDGEPSPRNQIPTAFVGEQIPEYEVALKNLFMTVPRPWDVAAHISN